MGRTKWARAALVAGAVWSLPASAIDGVAFEIGSGEGMSRARAALQWNWSAQWFRGSAWHLGGYWELSIGQWHDSSVAAGQNDDITDIGFTPVFRFQPNALKGPYVEGGIGAHLLSRSSIGHRQLSTRFQFGDHIGFGYRFGSAGALDVGYRFQHHSNAGIKEPNPGVNFHQVRVQYHF